MAFSQQQIKELSAKLDASHVKKRAQAGRQLSYVEGWHMIAEANRIFGFDRWHRETVELRQLGEPREVDGKWRVAYMARVKVEVFAGEEPHVRCVIREGCGYGSGIDKDLGSAHESALKEAETDAMKRALMTFGNPFGLALYDKDQENVEHAAEKPAAPEPPEKQQAREMYGAILAAIAAATHPGDAALGLKVDKKDREDVAFIRKWGGNTAADTLHTKAALKIAELTKEKAAA
jgi:DNA repair and recombination protein RAD52